MEQNDVYKKLAKKLDQNVLIGAPMAPSLIQILEVLFPDEESHIAVKLSFNHQPLSELKALFPDIADSLEEKLDVMAKRGTVFSTDSEDGEKVYALLPTVVGFSETPFWPGKVTEDTKKLAPLWLKYRDEAFGEELSRGMPAVRVLPVARSLKEDSAILPFDVLKKKLEGLDFLSVAHCPCRQMMTLNGDGCDHSLENCLHFGEMGRYMVKQGMAREISKDEAIEILHKSDDEGLVHICENMEGYLSTICNCCSCCCVFLQTKKTSGLNVYQPSNYVSSVDKEICVGCGTCESRCPVDAVSIIDDGFAVVTAEVCIGCGICTPTCEAEAISLVQRETINPPPKAEEFLMARYKGV